MAELPNLRHLYAATEVARLGSISRASEAIHLSQSAITQGLGKLEASLGLALFNRTSTGMFATEAGEIFLARIERAIGWLKLFERELGARNASESRPLFRLATSSQLRALVAVVESGSFSLAARELGLSQPTVHRAARDLEALCAL